MARELIYKDEARRAILKENPSVAFCIDNIKAVDAKEVVHGHWTTLYKVDTWMGISTIDCFICSECGVRSKRKGNYCPNCGADMRGVEDG